MYVCLCKGLTETDVQRLARDGDVGPDGLITALKLDDDDCCGRCARSICELMTVACGNVPCAFRQGR